MEIKTNNVKMVLQKVCKIKTIASKEKIHDCGNTSYVIQNQVITLALVSTINWGSCLKSIVNQKCRKIC